MCPFGLAQYPRPTKDSWQFRITFRGAGAYRRKLPIQITCPSNVRCAESGIKAFRETLLGMHAILLIPDSFRYDSLSTVFFLFF